MTNYNLDRDFTDYVHTHLAVPSIYFELGWTPTLTQSVYTDERDKQDGIDYQAFDNNGFKVTVQERFRDAYYSTFNDFTIRYTRENSLRDGEHYSEFFKIDATYFIYGITDGKKYPNARSTLTRFVKYVVFNVNNLKDLFRQQIIRIPSQFQNYSEIRIENGKKILYTAKKRNSDGSSEFIAIDPAKLKEVLGMNISSVIVRQVGFYDETE